jgi:hypothetical protein
LVVLAVVSMSLKRRSTAWAGGADVLTVMVDPANFATTQMVIAVATDVGANAAKITTKYSGAQWAQNAGDITLPNVASFLINASLWLPDDFNSNLASGLMQAFIGVSPNLGTGGDVYLAVFAAAPSNAFDLNIGGPASVTNVYGLDGIGSAATASLIASGSVFPTANNTPRTFSTVDGGLTWTPDIKAPTGGQTPFLAGWGTAHSILLLDTANALCATHGANSGVSVTADFGATWNGASKMNASIVTVDDLELGSVFISTSGLTDDIWRSDGTNWERVFSGAASTAAGFDLDRDLAGSAIFAADLGGTTIMRSINDGQTWTVQVSAIPAGTISAFAANTLTNLLVGSGPNLYHTPNNGVIWFTRTVAVGTILSFAKDAGGDLIVAGTTALARSQDSGYATDSKVYATGDQGGIWVYDFSATTPAWTQKDVSTWTGITVVNGAGLVAAPGGPDGMVYAAEANAAGDGVIRLKANRANAEQMADAGAAAALRGLWYEAGSNKLYTLAGNVIRTYTDTLAVSGSGVAITAITGTTATISWNALPNATQYHVVVHPTAQQDNIYVYNVGVAHADPVATTLNVVGLANNTTYFVSVHAWMPVSSFMFSGTASFTTLPGAVLAPPQNLIPAHGAINIPVDGPAFAWGAPVGGATSYDWQLSTDPTFTVITEGEVNTTLTFLVWPGPLAFEQDYYWRVRANTAAGVGPWATQVFTTVAEGIPPVTVEPPPTPTITVSVPPPVVTTQPAPTITVDPPDVIVTVPQPTTTVVTVTQAPPIVNIPEDETPVYIWVIVAIGALLTIAVIVLIVRTRRVV